MQDEAVSDLRRRCFKVHDVQTVRDFGEQEVTEEVSSYRALHDGHEIRATREHRTQGTDEKVDMAAQDVGAAHVEHQDRVCLHVPERLLAHNHVDDGEVYGRRERW